MVLLSTLKLLRKSDRSTENGLTNPGPVKNPSILQAMINITVVLMSSIALIFFWTRTIHGTWFQQLLYYSTTLMIDTLCLISTLSQQFNNLEQSHVRSSLHCERWTVKVRDCASVLLFFRESTYRMDEWTKQLQRLKNWVISGNPEQWTEFCLLWWTAIVFECSYLLQLFDFYCLLVQHMFSFWKFTFFVPFPWWIWVSSKSSSTTSIKGNTP